MSSADWFGPDLGKLNMKISLVDRKWFILDLCSHSNPVAVFYRNGWFDVCSAQLDSL